MILNRQSAAHRHLSEEERLCSPQEAAQFIADLTLDLRNISNRAKLGLLTLILEMAVTEAMTLSRPPANRVAPSRAAR